MTTPARNRSTAIGLIIPVIVPQAGRAYLAVMASALFRLLALLALLLMPAGMAGAPALAQPAPAAAGHCDEHQEPTEAPSKPMAHCTGCSALPAIGMPAELSEVRPQAPRVIAHANFISGVEPEIATPPPKRC